ncbi:MAG: DMT family transporter [Bacteroidales bacterium]|nr:DMT family transporter [Bacteroidales bacterium]
MSKFALQKKSWQWITLLFLSFIWGTSFILMKRGLEVYNNYHVAAFRIFFSFILMVPVSIKHINKITRENIKSLLVVGFIGTAFPAVLFTTAQTRINSSLAGMLNSLTPFFTLLIGLIFYNSKVKFHNLLGILLGMIGAILLILKKSTHIFENINYYALFILLATLFYGINVNEIKARLHNLSGLEITSLAMLFIGPFSAVYLLFSDFNYMKLSTEKWTSLFYIFLLAAFCSVLALIIFNSLIKHTTAIFAASVTYIIPAFAIFWGIFDGETVTLWQFLWISLILFGVYLVNKR